MRVYIAREDFDIACATFDFLNGGCRTCLNTMDTLERLLQLCRHMAAPGAIKAKSHPRHGTEARSMFFISEIMPDAYLCDLVK